MSDAELMVALQRELELMKELSQMRSGDPEVGHSLADTSLRGIMLMLAKAQGESVLNIVIEIDDLYESVEKWYA